MSQTGLYEAYARPPLSRRLLVPLIRFPAPRCHTMRKRHLRQAVLLPWQTGLAGYAAGTGDFCCDPASGQVPVAGKQDDEAGAGLLVGSQKRKLVTAPVVHIRWSTASVESSCDDERETDRKTHPHMGADLDSSLIFGASAQGDKRGAQTGVHLQVPWPSFSLFLPSERGFSDASGLCRSCTITQAMLALTATPGSHTIWTDAARKYERCKGRAARRRPFRVDVFPSSFLHLHAPPGSSRDPGGRAQGFAWLHKICHNQGLKFSQTWLLRRAIDLSRTLRRNLPGVAPSLCRQARIGTATTLRDLAAQGEQDCSTGKGGSMRYGVYVPNFGPYGDARVLADLAVEAEGAGWDGFFLWDQVSRTTLAPAADPLVDPWIALTAIALRTRTILLGPLVTPLPRRRPWMLARETVSLDHLSTGRLIFGVGSGGGFFDFEALGEPSDARELAERLDEGLEVLTGLWSGKPYRYEGSHYHIKEACFLPRPHQSPRIPIWVAGMWPVRKPFRRAARWDGVIPIGRDLPLVGMLTPEEIEEVARYVGTQPAYAPPFEIVHMGVTTGTDADRDRAVVDAYRRAGVTWWIEKIVPERWGSWSAWPLAAMRTRIAQGPVRPD